MQPRVGRKRPRAAGGGGGAEQDGTAAAAASQASQASQAQEPYRRLQEVIKRTTALPMGAAGAAGSDEVDPACWAELKQMLKGGTAEAAAQAFTLLVGQLRDRRIGVRMRALALLDRLVQRSAAVRKQTLDHLRDVLDLTMGGSGRAKLPPPAEEAARLRTQALGCLEEWHARYAGEHPGVRVAYLHLKEGAGLPAGMALPDNRARREEAQRRAEAQRAERARSLRARYLAHRDAMRQGAEELRGVLDQMQACFDIVVPDMRMGLEALGEAPAAASAPSGAAEENDEEEEDVEWESGDEGEGGSGLLTQQKGAAAAAVSWEDLDTELGGGAGASDDEDADDDDDLFGFGNAPLYEIEVELPWLGGGGAAGGGGEDGGAGGLETADVKPVFDQLRELYRVLKGRLLPQAEQWWRLLACTQGLLQQEAAATGGQEPAAQYPHHESAAALLPECRQLLQEMAALRTRAQRTVEQCAELRTVVTEQRAKKLQQGQQGKGKGKGTMGSAVVGPPAATLDLERFLEEDPPEGMKGDRGKAKKKK